jgi:hypothetical protein
VAKRAKLRVDRFGQRKRRNKDERHPSFGSLPASCTHLLLSLSLFYSSTCLLRQSFFRPRTMSSPFMAMDDHRPSDLQHSPEAWASLLGLSPDSFTQPHTGTLGPEDLSATPPPLSPSARSNQTTLFTAFDARLDLDPSLAPSSSSQPHQPSSLDAASSRKKSAPVRQSSAAYSIRFSDPLVDCAPRVRQYKAPSASFPPPAVSSSSKRTTISVDAPPPPKPKARSSASKTPRARKAACQPPKPPNAWILYRSDQFRLLKKHAELGINQQASISMIVAQFWRAEKADVRLW